MRRASSSASSAPAATAIRRAVLEGCPGGIEIGDRAQAIGVALRGLEPGDVLVIAGKGHEQGQTIAGVVHPFDDATVARQTAERLAAARLAAARLGEG